MAEIVRLPTRIDLGRPWQPFSPSQILERPAPRQWLLDGIVMRGTVTVLAGDWKLGKSLLLQQILSAVALGKPCLGRHTEKAKTFGYFCEDEDDILADRQFEINANLDADMLDYEDNFRWRSMAASADGSILADTEFGRMKTTGEWEHLWRVIDDEGSELIGLDTAGAIYSGNENSRNQVTWFMRKLQQKAIERQRAILLLMHPPKADKNGFAGSGAWISSARGGGFSLRRPANYDEETGEPQFEREIRRLGANYSVGRARIKLMYQDGVFVSADSDPPPPRASGFFSQSILDNELLGVLQKCRRDGADVPAAVLKAGSLPEWYRRTFDRRTSLNDLYAAQERLVAAGKVLRVNVGGRCLLRAVDGFPYSGEEPWRG